MMRDIRSIGRTRFLRVATRAWRHECGQALAIAACLASPFAHATTTVAAAASDPLAAIDARLAQNPKDAQLQFRRGVALSAAGRAPEAIATFKRLIDEHPELAAAYNNLAALQADQGDDDAARALLQKAVQLKPGYATALHNLGDVHLRLAAAAYTQASTSDPTDTLARSRVASLRTWMGDLAPARSPVSAPTVQLEVTRSAPARPVLAASSASAASAASSASSASSASRAASTPVGRAAAANDTSISDVTAIVRNWADDWSHRDTAAYLGYYAPDFKGRAADHIAWQADRTARLTRPKRIQVTVDQLVVSVIGSNATARFRQSYTSDTLSSVDKKALTLVRNPAGRWLITGEAVER